MEKTCTAPTRMRMKQMSSEKDFQISAKRRTSIRTRLSSLQCPSNQRMETQQCWILKIATGFYVQQATVPPAKGKASRSEMKRWRPSLTGENEPWAAFTPLNTPKFPQKTWKSNSPDNLDEKLVQRKHGPKAPEEIRPESTEYCPSTSSRNGAQSFSTLEKIFPKLSRGESPGMFFALGNNLLPDQGPATKRPGQSFQDLPRFNGLDDDFEMYGNAMGSGFDQQIPQGLDDSLVLSMQDSESVITQTASEYITAWDATLYPTQVHLSSSNMHNSIFINEECCRLPPKSTGQSSAAAPWAILSRDTDPLAVQTSPYTPTSRGPQQLRELDMLEGQNKLLSIDWSLQGFD